MRRLRYFYLVCLLCAGAAVKAAERAGEPDQAIRKLYLVKCAKCHKLYDPAKYSDQRWQVWMNKMSQKAKLQPDQKEQLVRYIEEALRAPKREPDTRPAVAR